MNDFFEDTSTITNVEGNGPPSSDDEYTELTSCDVSAEEKDAPILVSVTFGNLAGTAAGILIGAGTQYILGLVLPSFIAFGAGIAVGGYTWYYSATAIDTVITVATYPFCNTK